MPGEAFGVLPLDAQIAELSALIARRPALELLELCASLRDHAPLAWLCGQLLRRQWLAEPAEQQWFASFLVAQPETAVDKVLRALLEESRLAATAGRQVAGMLIEALRRVSLAQLPSMCLLDRALRHGFAEERDRHLEELAASCAAALREGRVEALTLELLAQLPARALEELRACARSAGPPVLAAFEAMRGRLAAEAIRVLGGLPKAVSQANAEELLSRRVYTDPGHFLIELLQNAEDAGAVTWRLTFDANRIIVWHDGLPFDTKDLVGVCSIGQTTKRKQQIGFFGVGFKSVYEVTDRPRIYSDVYRFEIADVSIPKALASWPADLPQQGTVLILPLRNPRDPQRSPRALFDRARALDPVVLFTLRSIQVIELELTSAAGGPQRYSIREGVTPRTGWSTIQQQPDGWTRFYALCDDEYRYDGGVREAGKTDRTRIMLGLRIDPESGLPVPLEPSERTVYSFLPTDEQSGLRFFVQSHFDLPVDRERITQDSAWNRWVLRKVPEQLARLVERLLAAEAEPARQAEVARALLGLLPLLRELPSPLLRTLSRTLPGACSHLRLTPCADGVLRPPPETVLAPAAIAALFPVEPLWVGDGQRHLADPTLEPRTREVLLALGSAPFDHAQLLDLLEKTLAEVPDGGRPGSERPPLLLREASAGRLLPLYRLLQGELEARERAGEHLHAARQLERLRQIPLLLGADGGLHRPRSGLRRGAPALRAIYAGLHTFIDEALEPASEERDEKEDKQDKEDKEEKEEKESAGHLGLFKRFGVRLLDARQLVNDLEASLAGKLSLDGPEQASLPGTAERLRLIVELLAESPARLRSRSRRLPLFEGQDGRLYRVAQSATDLGGVLCAGAGSGRLLALYGGRRPLLADPSLAQAFSVPELTLETLLLDLRRDPPIFPTEAAGLRELHAALEGMREELPARLAQELARTPIWPARDGEACCLVGDEAVRVPEDEEVCALFPRLRFLDAEVQGRAHLAQMPVQRIGAEQVLEALRPEAPPALRIEPGPESLPRVQRYLGARLDSLGSAARRLVRELPLFLSDDGRVCRLDELTVADAEVRGLYHAPGERRFLAEGEGLALLRRLGLEGDLKRADLAALIGDLDDAQAKLERASLGDPLPIVGDGGGLLRALEVLAARSEELSRAALDRLLRLPVFPDEQGKLCRLAPAGPLRPCPPELRELLRALGASLLDASIQQRVAPLLAAAGMRPAAADLLALIADPVAADREHPLQAQAQLRHALYGWLLACHDELLADTHGRELLARTPLVLSRGEKLLAPAELVLDAELPDLGVDWQPHPEVPAPFLDVLQRRLGVGQPRFEELITTHLRPAYQRAASAGESERADRLLVYLAARLLSSSPERCRTLLCSAAEPFLVEDQAGRFRPLGELLLAGDEIAAAAIDLLGDYPRPAPRHGPEVQALLSKLGVARLPPLDWVRRAMEGPLSTGSARALASLLFALQRAEVGLARAPRATPAAPGLVDALPLRSTAWVPDGAGCLRRPAELFLWDPEVEALAGDFPELYADAQTRTLLGEELCRSLGFRATRDLTIDEVARHLEACSMRGRLLPFRAYLWMEEGLQQGWLDEAALRALLGDRRWVCSDDGEYFNHRKVIGQRALRLFGNRRGYWERGRESCPRLLQAFGIPSRVTAASLLTLLREVGAEAIAAGDRTLLEREAALPRMLLACYAWLGENEGELDLGAGPSVLCREHGEGALRLLPPTERGLYRSDTPTLERLFRPAGLFHLAVRGSPEDHEPVDRFLGRAGVRWLREAYRVEVDQGGADRSEARSAELGRLMAVLGALAAVLPRVRRQRTLLASDGWVDRERLVPVVAAARVRAIEGLQVRYVLEGVGEAKVQVPAVYDPERGELLVEAALLDEGVAQPGLAAGLVSCIYVGPGEEALTDIVEILLPLGTRERMEGYLDRRHFPAAAPEEPRSLLDRLAGRLAEILDYGLDRRLRQRFPELEGKELASWRERDLVARTVAGIEGDLSRAAAVAAPLLLDAAGASQPGPELVATLTTLLAAPTLGEIPPGLLGTSPAPAPVEEPAPAPSSDDPEARWSMVAEVVRELAERGSEPPIAAAQSDAGLDEDSLSPLTTRFASGEYRSLEPLAVPSAPASPQDEDAPRRPGFWRRVRRWFGGEPEPSALPAPPAWASPGGRSFSAADRIAAQLWASRTAREQLAATQPSGRLYHSPSRLPAPYTYAVQTIGVSFDRDRQSWTPRGFPRLHSTGGPSGATVELTGWLPPGPGLLPMPLYSRLRTPPRPAEGSAGELEVSTAEGLGGVPVQVSGARAVAIRYEVELLELPLLTVEGTRGGSEIHALIAPTVEERDLPSAVRDWLEEERASGRSAWEHALSAQSFVQRRYCYDDGYRERREVERALARLAPGRGNHHLTLLHAGAGDGHLGRGICYELNSLVVELLRQLGVPAVVASGWTFVDGVLDRPDHLFALALVPSTEGPCVLPLDAAVSAAGVPLRPLPRDRGGRSPELPERPAVSVVPGPWSSPPAARDLGALQEAERRRMIEEERLLRRALRLLSRVRGAPLPAEETGPGGAPRLARLRELVADRLGDRDLLGPLLDELGNPGRLHHELGAAQRELVRLGLFQPRSATSLQLWPADRERAVEEEQRV